MRYIRSPAALNGQAVNRSAVTAGRPAYPRARPAPAMYSSPATPGGTGSRNRSSTSSRVLLTGVPIGTCWPGTCWPARTWNALHPTTVSVGPYSLTSTEPGAVSSHPRASAPASASPPATRTRAAAASCRAGTSAASNGR